LTAKLARRSYAHVNKDRSALKRQHKAVSDEIVRGEYQYAK